jgi:FKBP-type peptidyl-prolyl cis-trans isomerase 2
MEKAKMGSTVKVHYTGKMDDGVVFDTSRERDPLEFTIGGGKLIKGFEEAVIGMATGETKTITIPSDEAYGAHRNEFVVTIDRAQFPPHIDLREGLTLHLKSPDGNILDAVIIAVEEDKVTLDANHPLAGKDLTFEIELVEIV